MLTKVNITNEIPSCNIHNAIKEVILKYKLKNTILFTNGKIVLTHNECYLVNNNIVKKVNYIKRIPVDFCGLLIWKSIDSFDQNNYLTRNLIRKHAMNYLSGTISNNLIGIGGEFYGYFVHLKYYKKYIGFTNNLNIFYDSKFNFKLYFPKYKYELYFLNDYSKIKGEYNNSDCVVNLSKIPTSVINFLNKSNFNSIVIISCSQKNGKQLNKLKYKLKSVCNVGEVFIYLYKN
uniref:Uncharacterized protein n=1 Tax=viral metagenome TaxID=1070528 RepID=A0A6C0ADQ1_9ZZZZ